MLGYGPNRRVILIGHLYPQNIPQGKEPLGVPLAIKKNRVRRKKTEWKIKEKFHASAKVE